MLSLQIYKKHGVWMFNDDSKGIFEEPFVGGTSELIDFILKEKKVWSGSHRGIDIEFSLEKEAQDMVEITKVEDMDNDWALYEYKEMQGTLCPVTLQYLGKHPDSFFIRPMKKPFKFEFELVLKEDASEFP